MKPSFPRCFALAVLLLGTGLFCPAQTTNPYVEYINKWIDPSPTNPNGLIYARPGTLRQPGDTFSVWELETILRYTLPVAWAATDPRNTAIAAKKQQMRDNVEQVLDNIFSLLDSTRSRWWWPGAPGRSGDPNIDRFILISVCDILYRTRAAGLYPAKMDGWLAQLKPAIEFQLANYGAQSSLDWSTVASGKYANMDAAYALTLGLAARLYPGADAVRYSASANALANALNDRVYPDGATPYWMSSNENLHYHNYVVCWMSRYQEVSGDPVAATFLQRVSRYLPLALANLSYLPGDFTDSTPIEVKYLDPWWKFSSDAELAPNVPSEVLAPVPEIVASYAVPGSLTRRQNQWAANRILYRANNTITAGDHWSVKFAYTSYFAVDRWSVATNPAPLLAAQKLQRQRVHRGTLTSPYSALPANGYSNGFAGRFAAPENRVFAWVAGLGGLQRTLGAAYLMNADLTRDTALQMVMTEVRQTAGTTASALRDVSAYHTGSTLAGSSVTTPTFGAFGAKYRPTRPFIGNQDEIAPANFEARQVGLFTPTHVISFVELESLAAQSVPYIAVRVRSDRTPAAPDTVNLTVETTGDSAGVGRVYAIGGLRHRLVTNTFPTLAHGAAVNDTASDQDHHSRADEFILSRGNPANPTATPVAFTAGEIQRAMVDTYPQGNTAATGYSLISFTGVVGFQIVIDAYRYHVLFNKGATTLSLNNYNFNSNPGDTAVLFSSSRPDAGGHTAPFPITGTRFSEPNFRPGDIIVVRVTQGANPNFKSRDLGTPSFAGGHHAQPGAVAGEHSLTVIGSGGAMGTSDPGHFVTTQDSAEDGALTVRLIRADRTDPSAKYGIMIRSDDTSPGAPGVFLRYSPGAATSPTGTVNLQWRTTANGTLTVGGTANLALPCWLRVARAGNSFTASTSTDGTTWITLGTPATLSGFPAQAFWGLAANAHTDEQPGAALFERVSFVLLPPAAPATPSATVNGAQVQLAWSPVPGAGPVSYTVKRAATSGGPYTVLASGLSASNYTDTTATPGQTAYYIVTATNTAGEGPASAEVSALPLTALQTWRQTHFNTTANTGTAANLADPDADGFNNLLEYALGSLPTDSDSVSLPAVSTSNLKLQLTFLRLRSDLAYAVEATSDLTPPATWTTVATNPGTVSPSVPVTVTDTVNLSTANPPSRFLRLRVTTP